MKPRRTNDSKCKFTRLARPNTCHVASFQKTAMPMFDQARHPIAFRARRRYRGEGRRKTQGRDTGAEVSGQGTISTPHSEFIGTVLRSSRGVKITSIGAERLPEGLHQAALCPADGDVTNGPGPRSTVSIPR